MLSQSHWLFEPHFITFSQMFIPFGAPFPECFHVFYLTFSRINFAQNSHRFCIDFGMDLSLIFHQLCTRTSLRYQISRTLFLNNSIMFCAQNKVFTLSEKNTWFSPPSLLSFFISTLNEFWHRFHLKLGRCSASFSLFAWGIFQWISDSIFCGFWTKRDPLVSNSPPPWPPSLWKGCLGT